MANEKKSREKWYDEAEGDDPTESDVFNALELKNTNICVTPVKTVKVKLKIHTVRKGSLPVHTQDDS
ncbi:MAG TPA: hypothetical protein VKK79_05085 [Candidatus Lokiarchaeia archaeon]|nr:hypothetical protein [Candidatus Lokiarchaeia archaeon]